ncbi:MAG: RagB/SusD family nutrient uptake outer membrane protein [Candidatus Saccharibacteria bacterium]
MKKLILILFIALFYYSCDDMIREDELNKLSINNTKDLEFAVAGLYHQFAGIKEMQLLNNGDDVTFANSYTGQGDGCIKSYTNTNYEELYLSMYKPLYQSIACANDIIKKVQKLDQATPEIKHLLGEVYFIRAYSYFWLVRLFGQVPIIDNVDVDYTVAKASYLEIYIFIESDFQKAISLLPSSNSEARKRQITPHRGTAKAILAEVYLNWAGYPIKDAAMYGKSAAMAKEVIDSAGYFGFGLMNDIAGLWDGKHPTNEESVFSIYNSGIYDQVYPTPNPGIYWYYPFPFENCNPAVQFYNSFPNNYRKDVTYTRHRVNIYRPDCVVDSLNPDNTYCPPVEVFDYWVDSIDNCYLMKFNKMKGSDQAKTIYLFRYAHTLLTYAEAKARSGSLDYLAFESINQIRRRANKLDIHSASTYDISKNISNEQFADSVVWEKALEFCAEPEGRWFDLLRLEKIKYLKDLRIKGDGNTVPIVMNMETYFFPIPKEDQMLNLNLQ